MKGDCLSRVVALAAMVSCITVAQRTLATIIYCTEPIAGTLVRTDGITTTTIAGGMAGDTGVRVGPDGNIYVSEEAGRKIDRFSPAGKLLGSVAAPVNHTYVGIFFASDGLLYASLSNVNPESMGYIERFDPATFKPLGSSLAAAGDLAQYSALNTTTYYEGFVQASDGNFYAAGARTNSVDFYQGPNGVTPGALVRKLTGGLSGLAGVNEGPDGAVYVTDATKNAVLRYDGTSFKTFATKLLSQPVDLQFGSDGNLYVSNGASNQILEYQGPSGATPGAYIGVFASTTSRPSRFIIVPEPSSLGLFAIALVALRRFRRASSLANRAGEVTASR